MIDKTRIDKTRIDKTRIDEAIEQALREVIGDKCPDFAEGCLCCEVWARWEELLETEARMERLEK